MSKIYNEITIITVLYNSSEIVESFFDSLKNFKIIVVDNGKTVSYTHLTLPTKA